IFTVGTNLPYLHDEASPVIFGVGDVTAVGADLYRGVPGGLVMAGRKQGGVVERHIRLADRGPHAAVKILPVGHQLTERNSQRKVDALFFVAGKTGIVEDILNKTFAVLFSDVVPHRLTGKRCVYA